MHLILVLSNGTEIDAGYVGVKDNDDDDDDTGDTPSNPGATTYIVTFKDHDGTVLKTETVEAGKAATAPADPTREGYEFIGWDKDFSNITGDLIVTARYEKSSLPTFTMETIYVSAGDTRQDMLVSLENNPGIAGLQVILEYNDQVLTVAKVGNEEAFDGLSYQKPANYKNGCTLLWYGAEPDEIMDSDAFYIRFSIAADAPAGTYPVKLIVVKAYDVDKNNVEVVIISGNVIVE